MMNLNFLLIFGFLLATSHWILADDEQTFREACIKEQENLTPAEIKLLNENKIMQQQNASNDLQCFVFCMYRKFGIVTAEDKHNPEAFIKYLQKKIPDKTKMMAIMDSCSNTQKNDNSCTTIFNFDKCVKDKL